MEPNNTPTPESAKGGTSKKFIRTFAGDMETFQKGGVPDLAPFEEKRTMSEEPIKKGPLSDETKSIPLEPVPLPSEIIPTISRPKFESPQPFVPAHPAEPEPIPIVVVPKPVIEESLPVQLETYSSDFKDRVRETHASTATVLAAEQDAASNSPEVEEMSARDGKTALYVIAGLVLLLVGSVGAGFAYMRYLGAVAPVIIAPGAATPIFVDSHEEVSGTGVALQQSIKQAVGKSLAVNSIRLLTLATSTETSIFESLSTRIPGILVRNINPNGSMAGVVGGSSGQSAFFILSVEAYSATFSGMLAWEPLMQGDLATIFPLYPATPIVASSTATTTVTSSVSQTITAPSSLGSRVAGSKSSFRDEVVSNHDVRIYRDAENRSIMLYGYWDEKTLVIARDTVAFAEILARLATSYTK